MFQGIKYEKNVIDKKWGFKSPDSSCESEDATEKGIPLLVCNGVIVTISFGQISDY